MFLDVAPSRRVRSPAGSKTVSIKALGQALVFEILFSLDPVPLSLFFFRPLGKQIAVNGEMRRGKTIKRKIRDAREVASQRTWELPCASFVIIACASRCRR